MTTETPGPIGKPRSVPLTILVTIVTFFIWAMVWSYLTGEDLKKYRGEGLGGILYLVITFILYPVSMFLLADEVQKMYEEAGEEPRITTIWGLWFLLPIIGQIIWYVRIQNAINEFWQARGGTMRPGLA